MQSWKKLLHPRIIGIFLWPIHKVICFWNLLYQIRFLKIKKKIGNTNGISIILDWDYQKMILCGIFYDIFILKLYFYLLLWWIFKIKYFLIYSIDKLNKKRRLMMLILGILKDNFKLLSRNKKQKKKFLIISCKKIYKITLTLTIIHKMISIYY